MLVLDSTAFRIVERAPAIDGQTIHVWVGDHVPKASPRSDDPNATARVLLAPVLIHYPHLADVALDRTAHGKPFFDPAHDMDFNLSHSGDHALVALAQGQSIGVDLEHSGRRRSVLALAQRFFCASEFAALAALPEAQQQWAFLRLWTCKEAVLKALGRGIAFGLHRLEFALDPLGTPTHLHAITDDGGDVTDWHVVALQPAPGYVGALAWHGADRQVLGFRTSASGGNHAPVCDAEPLRCV
ncbi:4'-phosphopantetheinyl transferase superfamily protein [Pseudolysobacter antarcticus]|uniref:4'-phosphopantetheinyl transferase superfamily protein n=1 Tax=Pseudolysobacter antarcticus TaxID=2511995 RepID=A0A411HEM8_9GAMM|nr:4'-phosphopantetheinyl transferase superfamily protein [Pseudolysobacter antarcticus]QBB68919.1 4'-phosphopantetheinyl transferase superfamily protein [Pseudolysobacter antarcticus]